MKASIIIINYNTPALVYACLKSIAAHLDVGYEIIVVDNGSSDRIDETKLRPYKNLRYIFSDKNLGFGGGNNLGAKSARGEFLWFLNSDTVVPDNSIEKLFTLLSEKKEIAIASPLLFNNQKLNCLQPDFYANFQNLFNVISRTVKPKTVKKENDYFETDVVVGASLIVKGKVFERLGGFDDKIFMFFDDDDLCYRAKELGFKTIVHTESRVIHLQGKSISQNRKRKKLYYASQNYFWRKHYGLSKTVLMRLIRFPYLIYRSFDFAPQPAKTKAGKRFGIDVREVAGKKAGKGYYVMELVEHLAKIDQENEYYLYSYQKFNWKLPSNFKLRPLPAGPAIWHWQLRQALKKDKVDAFLATLSYTSALFSPVPTVLVVHDLAVFYAPVKSKRKSVISEKLTLSLAARKAKKILAISEATKSELLRYRKNLAPKIEVATLAASDRFYHRPQAEGAIVLNKYKIPLGNILSVGTLEPRKNLITIIEAYANLPTDLQHKHPLVLAGKPGWYYSEIFKTVEKLGLNERVRFLNYVRNEDLPLLYNTAKIFIYPSLYEGFGLPVLEAIRSEVPTITSDAKALIEIGQSSSLTVGAKDIKGFTKAMNRLLTDQELCHKLIQEGLKNCAKFSWQETAKRTLTALKEISN